MLTSLVLGSAKLLLGMAAFTPIDTAPLSGPIDSPGHSSTQTSDHSYAPANTARSAPIGSHPDDHSVGGPNPHVPYGTNPFVPEGVQTP